MKKFALAALVAAMAAPAFAAQGDILARFRIIDVNPDSSWSNGPVGSTLGGFNVDADHAVVPEVDFTYMITNNIGAELILGTSRHKVKSNKLGDLGKVSVLPPTLTLQYHFAPEATFRPYVGAGINYTRFYNNDLKAGSDNLDIDKNSWGGALQIGADYAVNKDWFINADVKKIWLKTDVSLNGANVGELKINPWVFGLGVGTKF